MLYSGSERDWEYERRDVRHIADPELGSNDDDSANGSMSNPAARFNPKKIPDVRRNAIGFSNKKRSYVQIPPKNTPGHTTKRRNMLFSLVLYVVVSNMPEKLELTDSQNRQGKE